MHILEMKREDFEHVPKKSIMLDEASKLKFHSMVIIPSDRKHDSGWNCMDIVLVNQNLEPICKVETASDVIHLDGIGGKGYKWVGVTGYMVRSKGWKIDCLPCGYLRLFSDTRNMFFGGFLLSDLEIYSFAPLI